MKSFYLSTLAATALSITATGALAAAHTGGDMTTVTCEQFLALPAADQEMHATALTTSNMSDNSPMSESGADSSSTSDAGADTLDTGTDMSTDATTDADATTGTDTGTDMATDGTGTGAMGTGGEMTDMMSPTVVALVTICENTQSDMTGTMDSSTTDSEPAMDDASSTTDGSSSSDSSSTSN